MDFEICATGITGKMAFQRGSRLCRYLQINNDSLLYTEVLVIEMVEEDGLVDTATS